MCIIVAVPANVQMPDDDTLRECFLSNPDGAGFMWADGKSVRIRKGFMKFDEFMDALEFERIPEDAALVMHFRIATHGKVQPCCCHPFPVSSDPDELKAACITSRFGVAHNGVINGRKTSADWSDTMDYVAKVIAPMARMHPSFMYSSDAHQILEETCDSKLALLDGSGELVLIGKFYEQDGVHFSNTSYLPTRTYWTSYGRVFDGLGWDSRWTDSTYDDKPWDDLDRLVASLPWDACQTCPFAQECALWEPECYTEDVAIEASAYYNDVHKEEVLAEWEEVDGRPETATEALLA